MVCHNDKAGLWAPDFEKKIMTLRTSNEKIHPFKTKSDLILLNFTLSNARRF